MTHIISLISAAEHNQFNMTTNPEFAKNIFSEHFIYKYFKRIFDFLQKLTGNNNFMKSI